MNPPKRNGVDGVGVVVVAVTKIFVEGSSRVLITNVFAVVVDAIDRKALSEGGRLTVNDGWDLGCCCSGGGGGSGFRWVIDTKIQNSKKEFSYKIYLPNPSRLNGNFPIKHPWISKLFSIFVSAITTGVFNCPVIIFIK